MAAFVNFPQSFPPSRASSLLSKTELAQQDRCAKRDKLDPSNAHPRNASTSIFVLGRESRGTQGHRDSPQPSTGESPELEEKHEKQGDSSGS